MFKFRSGTHGLNEEFGRYRGNKGKTECSLCGDENMSHMLWECSGNRSVRASFMKNLQWSLEDDHKDFELLDTCIIEKLS